MTDGTPAAGPVTAGAPTATARRLTVVERDGAQRERWFEVARMLNLGSATRDPRQAVPHQDEVAEAGVRIAFDVPAPRIYPIGAWALTTDERIGVQGARTSGEAEIVLLVDDQLYIGVGSDHTDRDVERFSIMWSKQACPNVLGRRLWRWRDVRDHWDECRLSSTLDGEPYQDNSVAMFLPPPEILEVVAARTTAAGPGLVVFCGTAAALTGHLGFGSRWECRLTDPVLGRELVVGYEVTDVIGAVHPPFRVPVRGGDG
jgi:4-hydroxyphenylacetate 3-monooxygenase